MYIYICTYIFTHTPTATHCNTLKIPVHHTYIHTPRIAVRAVDSVYGAADDAEDSDTSITLQHTGNSTACVAAGRGTGDPTWPT